MTCDNCDSIDITPKNKTRSWDNYFRSICIAVATKSPCLSRKIGAILVRDRSIVATGYNGPPRGVPHCNSLNPHEHPELSIPICPRKALGYESGTHLELCPAQHAETNCIANAARMGVSVKDTILYMNCIIPCKNCFGAIINAGVIEIVVDDDKVYDEHTQYLIDNSHINIRRFTL